MAPQRINLQRVTKRPGRSRPWQVRWTVDGRQFSRGFDVRARADGFWAEVWSAVKDGGRFDPDTGLPLAWSPSGAISVQQFASQWLAGERATLARRSFLSSRAQSAGPVGLG